MTCFEGLPGRDEKSGQAAQCHQCRDEWNACDVDLAEDLAHRREGRVHEQLVVFVELVLGEPGVEMGHEIGP